MRILEIITDDSGKLSGSRVLAFIVGIAYTVFAGYICFTKAELVDIPIGVVGFIVGLYGLNKLSPTIPFKDAN